jgi:hypothetical protein
VTFEASRSLRGSRPVLLDQRLTALRSRCDQPGEFGDRDIGASSDVDRVFIRKSGKAVETQRLTAVPTL